MRQSIYLGMISLCLSGIWSGCGRQYCEPPNYYAEEAYRMQRRERAEDDGCERLDEVVREDLVLSLDSSDRPEWNRRTYETMEEWLLRIEDNLYANHRAIQDLGVGLKELEAKERDFVDRIQRYRKSNGKLRSNLDAIKTPAPSKQRVATSQGVPPPPFNLHRVKKGDTLYSIAIQYYNDADKVHDIMDWNQGWIRYPEQIVTGMSIILFDEQANDTRSFVVDRYLREVESLRTGVR